MLRVDLMRPVQFYAYHGTSLSKAKKIEKEKEFLPGQARDDHWLGYGSYFFREDMEQAAVWASFRYKNQKPAVLEANIQIPGDRFLNLDTRPGLQFLKDHIAELRKDRGLLIDLPEEVYNSPKVACLVFSAIDPNLKWAIFKTFPVYHSVFKGDEDLRIIGFEHRGESINFDLQGPQVCIRNNEAINEVEIHPRFQEKRVENIVVGSTKRRKISNDLFRKQ